MHYATIEEVRDFALEVVNIARHLSVDLFIPDPGGWPVHVRVYRGGREVRRFMSNNVEGVLGGLYQCFAMESADDPLHLWVNQDEMPKGVLYRGRWVQTRHGPGQVIDYPVAGAVALSMPSRTGGEHEYCLVNLEDIWDS